MAFQYMHILAVDWWNMWSLCSWLWRTDLRNLCLSYKLTTHLIMIELRVCLVYKSKRAKHLFLTWTTFSSHKFQPVIDKYAAIDVYVSNWIISIISYTIINLIEYSQCVKSTVLQTYFPLLSYFMIFLRVRVCLMYPNAQNGFKRSGNQDM